MFFPLDSKRGGEDYCEKGRGGEGWEVGLIGGRPFDIELTNINGSCPFS